MIIGAFPSARFERKNGKLIPITDNLSPFGEVPARVISSNYKQAINNLAKEIKRSIFV